MVAVQVALSVVLLSGSVLVLRGLQNALTVRLGFEPRGGGGGGLRSEPARRRALAIDPALALREE